jgi:hypothetical protein
MLRALGFLTLGFLTLGILGFRFAPPQALRFHPLRGFGRVSLHQFVQSFLVGGTAS